MLDSTYTPPVGSWAERWNAERRLRRAVRNKLTAGIDAHCVDAVMRQHERNAPPQADSRHLAALHVACQAALTLGWVWDGKRTMCDAEASTFRLLGGLAVRAGLSEPEVITAATSGVEGAIAAATWDMENCQVSWRTRLAILDQLKSEAKAFTAAATEKLRQGRHSPPPLGGDKAAVLLRVLDGHLPDDALGAAATEVGLDAAREHGVVLLIHPEGSTAALEAAALAVEATIPDAVDLGLSGGSPVCRRVIFPVLTHGRWIEARTNLHDIATSHGVLAVAPIQAPRLAHVADTYRRTVRDLARVVEGCGYSSGIIDPACIGTACKAEGTSPAPEDAGRVEALALSIA